MTLEVTALQADKLRIREWRTAPPEDASWAVLPASRTSRATVVADPNGFHTSQLSVEVGDGLHLVIRDHEGHILQEDSSPAQWRGDGFHIYKKRGENEHFFGLGDKPGPLDRAGQAFTMWNTDDFGWQESSDPIYKSIPFFMDVKDGRSFGILFDNTWRTSFDFGRENAQEYSFGSQGGPVDYYFLYGPEPRAGDGRLRLADRPCSVATALVLRLPAVALHLHAGVPAARRRRTPAPRQDPRRRPLARHRLSEGQHALHRRSRPLSQVPGDGEAAREATTSTWSSSPTSTSRDKPGIGYGPYDSGIAGDHFLKNPDGTTYVGKVWPGDVGLPRLHAGAARRKWCGTLYKDFVAEGVAGFWDDMNEPAVFRYPSKTMPLDDAASHRRTRLRKAHDHSPRRSTTSTAC